MYWVSPRFLTQVNAILGIIDCFVFEFGNSSNVSKYIYPAEQSSAKRYFMAFEAPGNRKFDR
jgi:hypothetical protein